MSESGFPFSSERIFTLSEANALVPELEQHWTSIKQGRQILIDTREEVKKASAQASSGGGTVVFVSTTSAVVGAGAGAGEESAAVERRMLLRLRRLRGLVGLALV